MNWNWIMDDYIHTFIVPIHLILESLVFYLLVDCSEGGLLASLTLHLFCVYILLVYVSFLFFFLALYSWLYYLWLFRASQHYDWVFPVASGSFIETQDPDVCRIVHLNLELIVIYLSTARAKKIVHGIVLDLFICLHPHWLMVCSVLFPQGCTAEIPWMIK
jgi:hypothetical protein